jgi:hypothetical protein
MKSNYEKIILNLKNCLFLLGDNFKNIDLKFKIKRIILDIEKINKKQEKNNKKNKININFNSNNPKKSVEIIDELIKKENENEKKLNDDTEF